MKWQNKGNEFDDIYNVLKEKKGFYLFGCGSYGKAITNELERIGKTIVGYIDNNEKKQGTLFLDKKVYSLEQVQLKEDEAIVLSLSAFDRRQLHLQLISAGYAFNKDYFGMEVFLSVIYAYERGEVYFPSISFLPSTACNLNCKACLNFTPFMEKQMVRPIDKVKADVDLFFAAVDRILLFHISGGEPLLYPHLNELIEYIGENYRGQIYHFETVTNGTVLPGEELIKLMKKYDMGITIDDYRETVENKNNTFEKIVEKFKTSDIRYEINKVDTWIDLAPDKTDNSAWDDKRLERHFNSCGVPWQELRDGKLYSCNYASYASVAGIASEREDEVYFLSGYKKENAKELMEFRMGYNTKGYTEFCKKCAGFVNINPYQIQPAVQIKR